jgi:hypothetical protein
MPNEISVTSLEQPRFETGKEEDKSSLFAVAIRRNLADWEEPRCCIVIIGVGDWLRIFAAESGRRYTEIAIGYSELNRD